MLQTEALSSPPICVWPAVRCHWGHFFGGLCCPSRYAKIQCCVARWVILQSISSSLLTLNGPWTPWTLMWLRKSHSVSWGLRRPLFWETSSSRTWTNIEITRPFVIFFLLLETLCLRRWGEMRLAGRFMPVSTLRLKRLPDSNRWIDSSFQKKSEKSSLELKPRISLLVILQ